MGGWLFRYDQRPTTNTNGGKKGLAGIVQSTAQKMRVLVCYVFVLLASGQFRIQPHAAQHIDTTRICRPRPIANHQSPIADSQERDRERRITANNLLHSVSSPEHHAYYAYYYSYILTVTSALYHQLC